jgi:hypothetical protein
MMKKFTKIVVPIPLIWLGCILIPPAALNYGGFCFGQARFISDNEKILIGVTDLNNTDPVAIKVGNDVKYFKAVRYKDAAEFIQNNPDCCRVTFERNYLDGPAPRSSWDRIFGSYGGDVLVDYKVRYIDEKGTERSTPRLGLVAMTNCGHIVEP